MKKSCVVYFVIICNVILGSALIAIAATTPPVANNDSKFMWIIGGLCSAFFTISTMILVKVDSNQTLLFERQKETNDKLIGVEKQIQLCPTCNHQHEHMRENDAHESKHMRKEDHKHGM